MINPLTRAARELLETGLVELPWREVSGVQPRSIPSSAARVFGLTAERSSATAIGKRVSIAGAPTGCTTVGCEECMTLARDGKEHIVHLSPSSYGRREVYAIDGEEYQGLASEVRLAFPDDGEVIERHRAGVMAGKKIPASIVRLRPSSVIRHPSSGQIAITNVTQGL